ncbi:META domain-containing protein [Frischella sp. Ac48]|uniref:META domain-containing protein n=1 Tax=Frischella japonica TaxID=2741544 RepID=A0ABR7QW74_9GAMM|nr:MULTISPECIES: META domain-containing protein [Frischella]MBC9130469.1 META domain-containing protein [Frischella japonica]MBX4132323.1 META domain-containing protein [Frischella sp. Ac48]
MKKLATICAVLGTTALLSACTSNKTYTDDLAGHRFVLTTATSNVLTVTAPPVIEFYPQAQSDRLKVVGKMCNNFNGIATYRNGILHADNLVMTRAICSETALNMLDAEISRMFIRGIKVDKRGDQLVLRSGNTTLIYTQEDIKR